MVLCMNIVFNGIFGKLYDILYILRAHYSHTGLAPAGEDSKSSFSVARDSCLHALLQSTEFPKELSVFFTEHFGKDPFLFRLYQSCYPTLASVQDFANFLLALPPASFKTQLLEYYQSTNSTQPENQTQELFDQALSSQIIGLPVDDTIKVALLFFVFNYDAVLSQLCEVLLSLESRFETAYPSYSTQVSEFNTALIRFNQNNEVIKSLEYHLDIKLKTKSETAAAIVSCSVLDLTHLSCKAEGEDTYYFNIGVDLETIFKPNTVTSYMDRVDLLALGKALGDDNRLKILDMLNIKPMYTSEIALQLCLPFPSALYHIEVLNAANMLCTQHIGRKVYYSLNKTFIEAACRFLKEKFTK